MMSTTAMSSASAITPALMLWPVWLALMVGSAVVYVSQEPAATRRNVRPERVALAALVVPLISVVVMLLSGGFEAGHILGWQLQAAGLKALLIAEVPLALWFVWRRRQRWGRATICAAMGVAAVSGAYYVACVASTLELP